MKTTRSNLPMQKLAQRLASRFPRQIALSTINTACELAQ